MYWVLEEQENGLVFFLYKLVRLFLKRNISISIFIKERKSHRGRSYQ